MISAAVASVGHHDNARFLAEDFQKARPFPKQVDGVADRYRNQGKDNRAGDQGGAGAAVILLRFRVVFLLCFEQVRQVFFDRAKWSGVAFKMG